MYVWGGWRKKKKLGREAKRVKGIASYMCTKGNERKGKERDDKRIECVSSDRNGTGTMKEERKCEGGTTSGVVTFSSAAHQEREGGKALAATALISALLTHRCGWWTVVKEGSVGT